ncbi:hypothetical protein QO002_000170 [Pararhizobium capsulatum DSM 1112]|uniref:Uncharacterized protein n=1 Tax=Pararhizobium capsulatum DSM 1112 TaxID=1121113 RepID=A0ABU0BJ40_9HYPH|nr:hypothetical protein [Pararhizobium capsulatum]MDQ0318032.1 hypothetical protein [Pararhizobium capsulatum DSM 1112]
MVEDHPEKKTTDNASDDSRAFAGLKDLPTESFIDLATPHDGDDRKSVRDLNLLSRLNKNTHAIINDQTHALGRYYSTIAAAGRLKNDLHAKTFPQELIFDDVNWDIGSNPTAIDWIRTATPGLELLTPEAQTRIVRNVLEGHGAEQGAAVLEMCGHLDNLHDRESIKAMASLAIDLFVNAEEWEQARSDDGCKAVALAYRHIMDEDMKTARGQLHEHMDAKPRTAPTAGERHRRT